MGIYVNQVGYVCNANKIAVSNCGGTFDIINVADGKSVYKAEGVCMGNDALSGEVTYKVDFTDVNTVGKYKIVDEQSNVSDTFEIGNGIYKDLQKSLSKALYFQRCGCALEERYAGVYTHEACHTADSILIDDYINKNDNPKKFSILGGWHDAGDFGRYSTAAAVALGHILYAYELFPESFDYDMNIPESGNGIPDILNECRYELDWLMKMQNDEGGVYHKLTAWSHAPFIMPEEDKDQFLLYAVSSLAVADFVAVMALASRVYAKFDVDFSAKAIAAARKSFDWLLTHDYVGFKNPEGSHTGEYGDNDDRDERLWAAAEMLRTDVDGNVKAYKDMLEKYVESDVSKTDFGWVDVSGFALLSVLTDKENRAGQEIKAKLTDALNREVYRLMDVMRDNGYALALKPRDFVWGSNMVVLNRAMLFVVAALNADEGNVATYKDAVYEQLHYILGRNALNRSYVTGFGEHAYKNPHNRPSAMDGIEDTMPGWVSGGPFIHFCDVDALKILPKGLAPMKCHADVVGSYSTNEITIYWNSPAIFVTAYLNSK